MTRAGQEQQQIDLRVVTADEQKSCPPGGYGGFAIAGRVKPYRLYWVVSDPDLGAGVWLASNR